MICDEMNIILTNINISKKIIKKKKMYVYIQSIPAEYTPVYR